MFKTSCQFWDYVLDNYDEEKQLIIENFIIYYINKNNKDKNNNNNSNKNNKYSKYNYEILYEKCIKYDKTGELNKLALIGTEFEKKILYKIQKNY